MKNFNIFFLFVFSFVALKAQQNEITIADALDKYLTEKYPANGPGASVLVMKTGKVLLRRGYGMANRNPQRLTSPDLIYKIGSITKQFTSTSILKLAQEGKLSLQDDVNKYFPGFTEKKITIEHLLQHTSGIKSYTSIPSMMSAEKKKSGIKQDELLAVLKTTPADFEPGDKYLYNNSGYYLLGMVIEKVSGKKYEEYLSTNFFKPLKMRNTAVDEKNLSSQVAVGYNKSNPDGFEAADYIHPTVPFSAGAIYSTIDDLWRWNEAVFSYKLVKKEWLEKAWTPLILKNGTQESYGYGWQFGKLNGKKTVGHGGAIDGFLSYELYEPESKIYVCILMNSMKSRPEDFAFDLAQMASGVPKNKPTAITLDEKSLQEFVGVYAFNDKDERVITLKNGSLFSRRMGGAVYPIFPFENDRFFFEDSDATLKFLRDASGKISGCETESRLWLSSFAKRTDKPLPTEAKEVEIGSAVFDRYIGEYELAPQFRIKVWREDKKFKAQATGQQPFDIYAESERKFFLKAVEAKIEFNQDEKGNVVSMTLFQNGREMPGKKIN